jgi:hypothetical protein
MIGTCSSALNRRRLFQARHKTKTCLHAGISDLASQSDKKIIRIDTLKACH